MKVVRPEPDAPAPSERPPWWLITSWLRWGWFGFFYPGLMGWFALDRAREGRSSGWDRFFILVLAACVVFGLVQLVLTLRAYRRDPGLRTREWPSPQPGPGLSRRVTFALTALAILVLGLLLLVYAGWGPALFVSGVLAASALTIRHFDMFGDTEPAGQDAGMAPRPHRDERDVDP